MPGSLRGTDVWFDGEQMKILHLGAVETRNTHGTGCTLSAALAANLALGHEPFEATRLAKNTSPERSSTRSRWAAATVPSDISSPCSAPDASGRPRASISARRVPPPTRRAGQPGLQAYELGHPVRWTDDGPETFPRAGLASTR